MNLLELTRDATSRELLRQVGGAIQRPPETAQALLHGAVSTVFAGLAQQASTPGGAAKVFATITEGGRSEGLLERAFDAHQVTTMSDALGARCGISRAAATRVLAVAASVAGGVLGKEIVSRRLGPTGVAAMLAATQKPEVDPAVDAVALDAPRPHPRPDRRARARRPGWGALVVGLIAVAAALLGIASVYRSPDVGKTGATAPQATPAPQRSAQTPATPAFEAPAAPDEGAYQQAFAFIDGEATPTVASQKAIDSLAAALRRDPGARIRLTGYSDGAGHPWMGRLLAESRSDAVKNELEQRGIDGGRVETAVSDALPPSSRAPAAEGAVGVELISR